MYATVTNPQVWQRWKQSERMALLATFEDSTTGTRVKEFCQALSRDLGPQCRIIEHVWLFSTLRMRELQEIAAEEASASDLIVISVHREKELPDEVKSWIDLWLQQTARHPAVLLALLDPDYEGALASVPNYLQEVAQRGSMDFMVVSSDSW